MTSSIDTEIEWLWPFVDTAVNNTDLLLLTVQVVIAMKYSSTKIYCKAFALFKDKYLHSRLVVFMMFVQQAKCS